MAGGRGEIMGRTEGKRDSIVRRFLLSIWHWRITAKKLSFGQVAAIFVGAWVATFMAEIIVWLTAERFGGAGEGSKAVLAALQRFAWSESAAANGAVAATVWYRAAQVVFVVFLVLPIGFVVLGPVAVLLGRVIDGIFSIPGELYEKLADNKREYQCLRRRQQFFGKPELTRSLISQFVLFGVVIVILWVVLFRPHTLLGWLELPAMGLVFLVYVGWLKKPSK